MRLPFWMVSPLAAAAVTLTAPTVWLVVPRSRLPPLSVSAATLPSVPEPLSARMPPLTVVVPV